MDSIFPKLEQHKDCIYDRVIFTEGGADGEVIDTICGQLSETDIVTKNSSSMGIRFISDSSVQKLGFEMRFQRELDECSKGEHDCEQLCINTVGSFTCGCREGFSLRTDRKTCESYCKGKRCILHFFGAGCNGRFQKSAEFEKGSYPIVIDVL